MVPAVAHESQPLTTAALAYPSRPGAAHRRTLSAALGITFIALGLLTGPWLLRRYGALAQSLLARTRTA